MSYIPKTKHLDKPLIVLGVSSTIFIITLIIGLLIGTVPKFIHAIGFIALIIFISFQLD